MKRVVVICVLFLMLVGCNMSNDNNIKEITIPEAIEKVNNENKNSFLLVVTTDQCYSCDEYDKVLKEIENIQPFDVYVAKYDMVDESKENIEILEELECTVGKINQFPTTYYFYQGNLSKENIKEGYIEKKELITWLSSLHILP